MRVVGADVIPTCVAELGDTMMDELQDEEIVSAVDSLDSDHWSDVSSPGELHSIYTCTRIVHCFNLQTADFVLA